MRRGAAAILLEPFDPATLLELCARIRPERALLRFEDLLDARTRALRESENRFRTLVENSPGVTYLCRNDEHYSMLFISSQILQLTGYDRAAFLAGEVNLTDLYHPDDLPGIRAAVDDAVARNSPFHLAYRLFHRDGSLRSIEEWGAVLAATSDVLLEGFMADVTEQTNSREAIRFQSQILDSVSEAVVATGLQGRILYWGRGAETQYGYSASEAIGRDFHDLAGAGALPRMPFDHAPWTGDLQLRRRDGSLFWASLFVSVLRDAAGLPAGFISLVHDITARKNAEQDRETLRETAEALSAVFLDLGPDTRQNMDRIVRAACELTGGAAALYNRLDETRSSLEVWSGHHLPPDMPRNNAAHGHICHQATILGRDQTIVLGQLAGTPYELTDPAVRMYGLKSYLGHPVHLRGQSIGALAVVDTKTRTFTQAEISAIQLLARALSLEEERHLVETELRQSEARNRALVSAIPDLMFVISKDGYFLDCHTNQPDSFARPPLEFLNKHVSEVLPPEMAATTLSRIASLFQSHQPQIFEYLIHVNGAPKHFEARIVLASGDTAMAISRDITPQKLAEDAERRERADRDLIGLLATEAFQSRDRARFQQDLLARLGESIDVSRAYIFTFNHTSRTIDNTAEWTAPGVIPQFENLQGLPASLGEWWISTLMNCGEICCSDIAQIPDHALRDMLRLQDILSVLVVPLFIGPRFCGFLGLDECRRHRDWSPRERSLLAQATRILMGVWADEELRQSEERFKGIFQNVATVAVQGYALDGTVHYWNRASESFYGYSAADAIGRNLLDLIIPPAMHEQVAEGMRSMAQSGVALPAAELNLMRKDRSLIPVYSSHTLVRVPGRDLELFCIDVDLTSLKQTEAQRELLQSQLVQAQKMESIGRLAGGVAHDFNNMLTVILGQAELALRKIPPDQNLHADIEQIRHAAQRSAGLTRQLLAFARKQTVTPRILDLNATVEGMLSLLRRLTGENIDLLWLPSPQLWPVFLDPSQLDQILTNLCVNARDAINGVGQITIRTANTVFDQNHRPRHPGFVSGDFVLLAVSDDGCGMDAETLSHLFEPFFTTKDIGRGTGLGLATVYGAVTQNNGFLEVDSQPGQGSTFRLYLPRHLSPDPAPPDPSSPAHAAGRETILLVEDEPAILTMATLMLRMLGYTTLPALSPAEAIRLAREHPGPIHLLLTDVIMPEMNGRDLAHSLLSIRPRLRRIFMSGYTANVIANHDIPTEGAHFIQKPFSLSGLAAKIREALQD
jgi:PAS domain S-box-containing protein